MEGKLLSRPQNVNFYFLLGIVWSCGIQRSQLKKVQGLKRIPYRLLPTDCIFGVAAQGIIPKKEEDNWWLLSILCSKVAFCFSGLIVPDKMPGTGPCANLPIAKPADDEKNKLETLAKEAYSILREWDTGNESSTGFIMPWLLQVWRGFSHDWKPVTKHPLARDFEWCKFDSAKEIRGEGKRWIKEASIIALANECVERELKLKKRLDEIQNAIDDEVYRIYDVSEEDRRLIEEELSTAEHGEEEKEEKNRYEVMPAEEHVKRLLSYFGLEVMKEDEDGIVPVSDMFLGTRKEPGMATRVIAKLVDEFGEANLDRIETELTKVLKMSIEEWFAKDFFEYHTTLYRLRPVIWQFSSERFRKGKPAFGCFSSWHKLDEDTIPKVRQLYLKPVFEASRMEVENIKAKLSKVAVKTKIEVENELESALTKYEEPKAFDEALEYLLKPHEIKVTSKSKWVKEKVKEITQDGYKPERDYGVRVNIEPLKQAGIMPKTADRVRG